MLLHGSPGRGPGKRLELSEVLFTPGNHTTRVWAVNCGTTGPPLLSIARSQMEEDTVGQQMGAGGGQQRAIL